MLVSSSNGASLFHRSRCAQDINESFGNFAPPRSTCAQDINEPFGNFAPPRPDNILSRSEGAFYDYVNLAFSFKPDTPTFILVSPYSLTAKGGARYTRQRHAHHSHRPSPKRHYHGRTKRYIDMPGGSFARTGLVPQRREPNDVVT